MMNFRMLKMSTVALSLVAGAGALSSGPAAAAPYYNFDFNSIGQNASSATIQTYMRSVIGAGSTLTVVGATGERGTNSYTGDDHVVGKTVGTTVYPMTLGNTDQTTGTLVYSNTTTVSGTTVPTLVNSPDGYIKNCTPVDGTTGCSGASPDIFINFGTLKIVSFSFDYEIFPDGTCTKLDGNGSLCGGVGDPNRPDLEIWTGGTAADHTGVLKATYWGATPSGSYTHSVISGASGTERAPQLLGHATINIASGYISTIDFMDWPETIAIDNLKVYYTPEPASIALFAFGIFGLTVIARRRRLVNSIRPA